jgi:alanyl-tRNA synthetase
MEVEKKEEIKKLVLQNQKDGKISCKKAFEIAESLGVPVRNVGDVIDELGIKIVACQLGCF